MGANDSISAIWPNQAAGSEVCRDSLLVVRIVSAT